MADEHLPSPGRDLPLWQYIAAVGIPAIPFLIVFIRWGVRPALAAVPSFHDSVDMINAFLASAAFAAVVLTLLLQRKDLHQQTRQFQESMQMQALATYLAVVDARREILAARPPLYDDADIRSMHLALAMYQIGRSLDRVELLLERSAPLTADADQAAFSAQLRQARTLIAHTATFDAASRLLVEDAWSDPSLRKMRDWLETVTADDTLPSQFHQQLVPAYQALCRELSRLQTQPTSTRVAGSQDDLHRELATVRKLLVAAVRKSLI